MHYSEFFDQLNVEYYVRRRKQLAIKFNEQIKERCKSFDKIFYIKNEYEGLESFLNDASLERGSPKAPRV